MYTPKLISRSLQIPILLVLSLVASLAFAHEPVSEQALSITTNNKELKWNDCPAFLPKGCMLSVLHGDPAKDNVDVFFKLPGKSALPLHWHTSAERMILVQGELHITYDGQKEAVVKAGTYMFGPAQIPHKGTCASTKPCILFIAFESPLDANPGENMNMAKQ